MRVEYGDLIGIPFVTGARGPDAFDCYGLVQELYRRWHAVELPEFGTPDSEAGRAALMADQRATPLWESVAPAGGVIVALRVAGTLSHVGFMLDAHSFIHTWKDCGGVCVQPLDKWDRRVLGFYRYAG